MPRALFPLGPTDVEAFTVVTRPIRSFSSSSFPGLSGSVQGPVFVYPRRSPVVKDALPVSSFVEVQHNDADVSSLLRQLQLAGAVARNSVSSSITASFGGMVAQYMNAASAEGQAARLSKQVTIDLVTPDTVFSTNTLKKLQLKDQLNTFYRVAYPTAHWAYTNYNTLNFFTASSVPSDSVIMYPNTGAGAGQYASGTYAPSGAVSFDFYINPRYQQALPNQPFKAGTILHLSSTYALSLVSGSYRDQNGRAAGFRLQLQLSRSADLAPSRAVPGMAWPNDLVFLSDDNSLVLNHWHHCVVRWGTVSVNNGSGTFNIDGVDRGTFSVPSASITPLKYVAPQNQPSVLYLGNFYDGPNNSANVEAQFFALDPATRDGLQVMWPATGVDTPPSFTFAHPLNAELHDVSIRRCYLSDAAIAASGGVGPTFLDSTFAFYVPPFFVEQSPYRQFVGDHGGTLVTPFQEANGATTAPFSVPLSFGVAGHYINLENFVKDFASHAFPRLHHLTASVITTTSPGAETCNEFLYSQPFVAKRNLTIMPCDDGLFVPGFQLLVSESLENAVNDLGSPDLSLINLDDMVLTSTLMFGAGTFDDGTQEDAQVNAFSSLQLGATPEAPFAASGPAIASYVSTLVSGSDVESGVPLAIFQRTQDPSSNEVTMFSVSNLFYGFRISPQTFVLQDPDLLASSLFASDVNVSGSGPVSVTLADDGHGNLYRADCLTSQSTWNSVGNLYMDEGIALVKSPHLNFFGQEQFNVNMRGEQHVHVMRLEALAPNNKLNSSSNPTYLALPPNGYPNDPEDSFVYISNVNFHDSDYNVVMKAQLAQPIQKRQGDRILIRAKFDF